MFQMICLFFPSFLSISFYNFLNNSFKESDPSEPTSWKDFLIIFGSFCTINNLISLIIISLLLKINQPTSTNGNLADAYLSIKSLLVATIVAIITALVAEVIHKFIQFKLTLELKE